MRVIVEKSRLWGSVVIPGSKSHTIRAVAIAALATGESTIRNPLVSSDTLSATECYRAFGAEIDTSCTNVWKVRGTGGQINVPEKAIDVGNSGTTLRVAVGTSALSDGSASITPVSYTHLTLPTTPYV